MQILVFRFKESTAYHTLPTFRKYLRVTKGIAIFINFEKYIKIVQEKVLNQPFVNLCKNLKLVINFNLNGNLTKYFWLML